MLASYSPLCSQHAHHQGTWPHMGMPNYRKSSGPVLHLSHGSCVACMLGSGSNPGLKSWGLDKLLEVWTIHQTDRRTRPHPRNLLPMNPHLPQQWLSSCQRQVRSKALLGLLLSYRVWWWEEGRVGPNPLHSRSFWSSSPPLSCTPYG